MELDADVIVVGAGPSGTTVAGELALAGVKAVVLERRTGDVESRAGTLLPRVLELFDSRGIADRFVKRMNAILPYPFRPEHIYSGLHFVQWVNLHSRFGFTLGLPQNHTEELLLEWCRETGAEVRKGWTVTGLTDHGDHVAVDAATADGATHTLLARYVVGADGGRSAVRKALDLPFEGHGGTFTGMVVDTEIKAPWPIGSFGTDNDKGWLRGFAFGPNITRFNMVHHTAMKKAKDVPITVEEVCANLRDIAGDDFGVRSFKWASRFDDTMRRVNRLREGRVFLVGESARIHYPASGVGMNFCIQDAFNLGWKLAAAVKGLAEESLLDTYQTERMPVIDALLDSVRSQVAMQFNFSEEGMALKRRFEAVHMPMREVNSRLARELNGVDLPYPIPGAEHPLAGLPAPDLDLVLPDGSMTRVGELLRGQNFALLDLAGTGAFDGMGAGGLPLRIVMAIAPRRTEASRGAAAMLVRPDGYVAWASDRPATAETARAELRRWLIAPKV